jgi:hypothetical protein
MKTEESMTWKPYSALSLVGLLVSLAAGSAAFAAEPDDDAHAGHDMAAMAPAVSDGAWSYHDRNNPRMHARRRWQMVPSPGNAGLFVSSAEMTLGERCVAFEGAHHVMVDRALRAACGDPSAQPAESDTDRDMDHGAHGQQHN